MGIIVMLLLYKPELGDIFQYVGMRVFDKPIDDGNGPWSISLAYEIEFVSRAQTKWLHH